MARSFFRKTTAGTIGTGRCPVISLIYTRLEQVWHAKNKRLPALRWRSPPPRHVPSSAPCKRSADRYYDTMSVQELLAELPAALIQSFAAKDCALMRLAAVVHQVVIAPHPGPGRHSEKPEEVRRRIERLYPGPYLELFGRKTVPGWTVWGNEIERGLMVSSDDEVRS